MGPLIHWDGTSWSAEFRPPDGVAIRAVWGSAASDVWIVGTAGAIFRYDGTEWTPVPSGTTEELLAISGSAADDVWIVGAGGTILRYDGSALSAVASGTGKTLLGVWGPSADDAWAVGQASTILRYTR
jgi:photosystem II stability/assembly factor-like uncharacterized protein